MKLLTQARSLFDAIPYSLVALFVRIVAAHPFLVSGQTKVDGPQIGATIFGQELSYTLPTSLRDATFTLFAEEYKVPLLSPQIAAYLATAMESLLPILLVLGLLTRVLRARPSGMTFVIQFFVYPDAWWTVHAYWAALLLVLIARGPGALALDWLFFRKDAR